MNGKKLIIPLFVGLLSLGGAQASTQDDKPLVMAPVSVAAGPLGYLGLTLDVDVDAGFLSHVSDATRINAMVIAAVTGGSPSHFAGLAAGDQVLRIDGLAITDYTLGALKGIREKEKGDRTVFVVTRPGSKTPRTIEVIVGTKKSPPAH